VTGSGAIGPLSFTGLRFLLATLVVLPFAWREGRSAAALPTTRRQLLAYLGCGLCLMLGSWTQQVGLAQTSVGNAGFLTAVYVALVPLLAWALFGRRPHWVLYPAIAICMTGIKLLTGVGMTRLSHGDVWVLSGSVFWALQILLIGVTVKSSRRPLTLACAQFAVTGIVATLAALLHENVSLELIRGAAATLLWSGVISAGVAFTLQVVTQRYLPSATAALIMSSEMVFAALSGWLAFGERLSVSQLSGAGLILLAILTVELAPQWLAALTQNSCSPGWWGRRVD
jgi:drug/metabolite transporter (DMT)-like permease